MTTFDPSRIILMTNAFDTLKNDDYQTTSVVIPGSVSVASAGSYTSTSHLAIGQIGSIADARIQTSRNPSVDYFTSVQFSLIRTGSLGTYNIFVSVYRTNPTTVACQAMVTNPYGGTMTGQAGDETITFKVRTFRAPF